MSENERGAGRQREWKLKKGLDAFGNIFGLNICFVIGCLPVFTIGASLAATYAMSIRLQEDEEETVLRGFISEFKRSFKQATIAFLGFVVAIAVLLAEWILINTQKGAISVFYTIVFYLELLMVALIMAFLFPLIARYNTTLKQAVKNSILLSVGYIFSCIKILTAWVAPIAFSIIYPMIFLYTWYLWLLILFGAIIWGTSHTVRFVFRQNEEALKRTEEEAEEEEKKKEEEERLLEEGKAALEEGRQKLAERDDESHEGGHGMSQAEKEHESAKDPEDKSIQQEQKEEKVSQKPLKSEELAKNLQQTKNAPEQGKKQGPNSKKTQQTVKVKKEQKAQQEKKQTEKKQEVNRQEDVRIRKERTNKQNASADSSRNPAGNKTGSTKNTTKSSAKNPAGNKTRSSAKHTAKKNGSTPTL